MSEQQIKAQCNKCLGETNHFVLYKEDQSWEEEFQHGCFIWGSDTFNMIKCCGCDSVKLKHTSLFSEYIEDDGSPTPLTNYYPPAISRAEPKWVSELSFPLSPEPEQYISNLICEIYSALHNDSRRLAVMGIRALLEHVMIAKVGDKGSFKANLNKFEGEGFLSKKQKEVIEPILEAGHAAMHRGYDPSSKDVLTVVEVTESLIETLYVHPKKASELKKRVPKRGSET